MIFGDAPNDKVGLIQFIKETILETTQCQDQLRSGSKDLEKHEVLETADLDQLIRDRFLVKTRNRIHYKVLEYFYKATQVIIHMFQDKFDDSSSG